MLVDAYLSQLESIIEGCGSVRSRVVHKDRRSDYVGYFRADLYFFDGSQLHVREFVFTRSSIIKEMYAYHYQDASARLIFRYDNTRHFPDLPDYPHHKHTPAGVISASEPDLQTIVNEIQRLL